MKKLRSCVLLAVAVMVGVRSSAAKKPVPLTGVLAASCGQEVVVLDPAGGWVERFETGPVGFLYRAPGGLLFAPDLVHGRTAVIDVRTRTVRERLAGVTMPHFGESADRYVVAASDMLVVSYPERAPIARIPAGLEFPWQVLLTSGQTIALVLDRHPERDGPVTLVAVDLVQRQVLLRRRLEGDVVRMALSERLGLLALADREGGIVRLMEPSTMTTVGIYPVAGEPRDVLAIPDKGLLAVAVASEGGGEVLLWKLKSGRKELERKELGPIPVGPDPQRLAMAPSMEHLAVTVASSRVDVVELKRRMVVGSVDLPAPARDLVWCDPGRAGPLLPQWSDRRPPGLKSHD